MTKQTKKQNGSANATNRSDRPSPDALRAFGRAVTALGLFDLDELLCRAAVRGDVPRIQALIAAGADVHVHEMPPENWSDGEPDGEPEAYGEAEPEGNAEPASPLVEAAGAGHAKAVAALLAAGARADLKPVLGYQDPYIPLVTAALSGSSQTVSLILQYSKLKGAWRRDGISEALKHAAYRGHAGVVDVLLNAGGNPYGLAGEAKRNVYLTAEQKAAVATVVDRHQRRSGRGRSP